MKEEAYAGYLPGTFAICRDYEIIPTVSLRDMSGFEETETGNACRSIIKEHPERQCRVFSLASIVEWIPRKLPKLVLWVRIPLDALNGYYRQYPFFIA